MLCNGSMSNTFSALKSEAKISRRLSKRTSPAASGLSCTICSRLRMMQDDHARTGFLLRDLKESIGAHCNFECVVMSESSFNWHDSSAHALVYIVLIAD